MSKSLVAIAGQGVARRLVALCLTLFLLIGGEGFAQERRGRLPNGLNYILRYSQEPRQKLEARLVLRFGSGVQRPDEAGFAHFIEHLAFSGSKHFPAGGAIRYAERLGARYGIGINALTGYDRTVYMLSLPTDEPHVLDSTCLLLGDWIGGLTFGAGEVSAEKRIIQEEIRAFEQSDPFYGLKIGIGRESRGLPVGTAEDIDRASFTALRRFYEKWYRASHATVLLVGDFDLQEAEATLHQQLSSLPTRPSILPPERPLSYRRGLTSYQLTDTLAQHARLDLIFPYTTRPTRTLDQYYTDRLFALALGAWSHRLEALRGVSLTDHWYLGRSNHLALTIEGQDRDSLARDLRLSLGALKSLAQHGIGAAELEVLKERQLARCYLADSTTTSDSWTASYLDQILHGDFFFTSRSELHRFHERMDALRPQELRSAFRELYRIASAGTTLAGYLYNPREARQHPFDSLRLTRLITSGLQARRSPLRYRPKATSTPPPSTIPTPEVLRLPAGQAPAITRQRTYPSLGVTEAFLSNGLRILLRPAGRGDSVVKITMTQASGQRHLRPEEQKKYASLAAYIEMGGIAKLPKNQLDSFIYDREIALTLTEGMDTGTLYGTAPTQETSALLRLIYEKMTDPERPYQDFEESRTAQLEGLGKSSTLTRLLARQDERLLQRRLDSVLGISLPPAEPATEAEVRALDLDTMTAYHIDQWTRTEGMTLTAVGDFDPASLLEQVARVFGHLPRRSAKAYPPQAPFAPEAVYTLTREEAGDEATLQHVFYGSYTPSLRGSLRLKLMREVLRNRLIERLRTQAGIIYSPYLYLEYRPSPQPLASFRLELLVRPQNIPRAGVLIDSLITDLSTSLPSAGELADICRTFLINKREALTESNLPAWQDALLTLLRSGESLEDFAQYESLLRSITPEEVREGFRETFSADRHLIYSLVPKQ